MDEKLRDGAITLKVLFTGYTSQQVGGRIMLGYASLPEMYMQVLQDAGHECVMKKIAPDEDISEYDAMIVGQAPLHSLGAYYLYPVLEAISRARTSNVALLFSLDDWQLNNLMSGVRTINKNTDRVFKGQRSQKGNDDPSTFIYKKDRHWGVQPHVRPRIESVIRAMEDRPWPTTIVPKFNWGDESKITKHVPTRELVPLDMSPYCTNYNTVINADSTRVNQWVLGTLALHEKWVDKLSLNWPVQYYGGPVRTSPYPRVKEPELLDAYAHSWGTMAVPYGHAGSGWYRHRYVHAMHTRCVMLVDPKDGECIGPSWTVKPSEIEVMTQSQLRELADAQYVEQGKLMSSKEEVQTKLVEAIQRAMP